MPLISEQHFRSVENLVFEWARAIDENRVEAICELLVPQGRYTVTSRFNSDRGLPMAIIDCHSAAQLRDRIKSMRLANVYEPQHYRHLISGVQIVAAEHGLLEVRSNFVVVPTLELDGDIKLFASGQCQDRVDISQGEPRFVQRRFIYDSRAVETLMIIPL